MSRPVWSDAAGQDEFHHADAAQLYHAFVQLVDKIQEKRLERICEGRPIENCTPEQVIDATDFMVSLKARYHGGTFPLFGVPWSQLLKGVLSSVSRTLKTPFAEITREKQKSNAARAQTATDSPAKSDGGTVTGAPS